MATISEALNKAFRAFRAGRLFEAEWICQELLQQQPTLVPALHLLGALAFQTGRLESAIAYYQKALDLEPGNFEAHCNLAVVLQSQGEAATAKLHFQQALALNPAHAPAHFNLGNLLLQQGDREAAIACYERAIALNPNYGKALNNLGNALRQQGRLEEAIVCYERAIALDPENAQLYNNLGNTFLEQGKVEGAIIQYQKALLLQPQNGDVHFNLGNALFALDQFDAASSAYQNAVTAGLERAVLYNNLGLALREQNQVGPAIAALQRAIALDSNDAEAHTNLGIILYEQQDLDGAIAQQQRAIAIQPGNASAHLNLSFALLASGKFEEGFAEYKWRLQLPEFQLPTLPGQPWDGNHLDGQTILLYAEQGLGDTIQFARYAPLVTRNGGRVVIACQRQLLRLLQTLPEISDCIDRDQINLAPHYHAPLLELPRLLGTTLETIPTPVPYLKVPAGVSISLPHHSQPTSLAPLKVGIVWASNPSSYPQQVKSYRDKNLDLSLLMELQTIPQVMLYSLQVGIHAHDITQSGFEHYLQDLSPQLVDFADTAAAIAQLDLVISIDTAVAHLTGALGKPVWVLLPYAADWRWLTTRNDSPWYPTMRLFRQPTPGDWGGVMIAVVAALTAAVEKKKATKSYTLGDF